MKKFDYRNKPWYPYAVAIVIGVVAYVVLTHLSIIVGGIKTFLGYFSPVIVGCVIAYIVNPVSRFYERTLFRRVRKGSARHTLADTLTVITVILIVVLAMLVILPQLFSSITMFVSNLDSYMLTLKNLLQGWEFLENIDIDLDSVLTSSENVIKRISDFVISNISKILSSSAQAGGYVFHGFISFLLSIYLLAARRKLKSGLKRLMRALFSERSYGEAVTFLRRCDMILGRYIMFNLLDSLIVFAANFAFMLAVGFPYAGLVSFVVAITNLLPTFGPIAGGAIGAFILLLARPWYALVFLVFTLILQICDGYILKPRMFGDSLGVSSLWILIGVIVGGRMFGVVGILLAIPGVAILDFMYMTYLMPWLEARRRRRAGQSDT